MSRDRISVAMATYNGEPFIREQLDSISLQELRPTELVVCDDGSTDGTLNTLEKFAAEAPFAVRIERNPERLGYVENFRKAAGLCSGDLIAFSDQDDWWREDKLAILAREFADPSLSLLYHNATVVDRGRRPLKALYSAEEEHAALRIMPFAPWHHAYGLVQAFRSELRRFDELWDLTKNHLTDPIGVLSHDQWYFFLALALGEVRFIDIPLVEYRQHGANTVGAGVKRSTVGSKIGARFVHYGKQDQRLAEAARNRCQVLRAIAELQPAQAPRVLQIAADYQNYSQKLDRRADTYALPSSRKRLQQLATSILLGDYANWPWGFDPRSVARDLWSGVVLSRFKEPS